MSSHNIEVHLSSLSQGWGGLQQHLFHPLANWVIYVVCRFLDHSANSRKANRHYISMFHFFQNKLNSGNGLREGIWEPSGVTRIFGMQAHAVLLSFTEF